MPRWIFHAIPTRLELGNKTILRIGRNVNEISPITTMIILSINVKSFRTFLPELFFALDRKWRNYLTSDSSQSVTEYLRNCNTRAVPCRFRAFRVPQLPSNFIITPLHPRTSFRPRGGGVFNYYYGNLNHPPNVHRSPALFTRNYLFDRDGWRGPPPPPPRVSPI